MKIKAYKNYGVLAHEKAPTYTVDAPNSTAITYDKIEIEIPKCFCVSENSAGELLISTTNGKTYLMSEILGQKNGEPVLSWYDGELHSVKCNYQEV